MKIKESINEYFPRPFAGLQIDPDQIELHSIQKRSILLPYHGTLPAALKGDGDAYISVTIRVGLAINACLVIKNGGKSHRYLLEATDREIDNLLSRFFFVKKRGTYHTAMGCGLDRYWLGYLQGAYDNWNKLVCKERSMREPA